MLIRAIRLFGHPGIGDVSIDLCGADGSPYGLVILAGENGTGKSSILRSAFGTLSGYYPIGGRVEIDVELSLEDVGRPPLSGLMVTTPRGTTTSKAPEPGIATFVSSKDSRVIRWGEFQGSFENLSMANGRFPILFSESAIDFDALASSSPMGDAAALDKIDPNSRGNSTSAGLISEMFVQLRRADSEDVHIWTEEHPGQAPPEAIKGQRLRRFTDAFGLMFPTKRISGTTRIGKELLRFEEFGRHCTINDLSTGEKQIVFRGGYLLRHQQALADGIVFIDEPELSLHPDWQRRIIPFFRSITAQTGGKHPQIIVATHSPFIVHGAPGARVIVLEKDRLTGQVKEAPEPRFAASPEAISVAAFGIEEFIAFAAPKLVVLTEGKTDAALIETAWAKLRPSIPVPFTTRNAYGAKNLSTILNDQEFAARLGSGRLLAIFDFDQEGYGQWKGAWKTQPTTGTALGGFLKAHASVPARSMLLPVPLFREPFASQELGSRSVLSIEMLFEDNLIPAAMSEVLKLPGSISIRRVKDSQKAAFAEHAKSFSALDFAAFEPIIAEIERLA